MSADRTTMIDPATLAAWIESGDVTLYDVREVPEFRQARIPGSILMPLSTFDPDEITVAEGSKLVFHCKSGVRCGMAADLLRAAGNDTPIHRLEGGIIAWAGEGYPVEPGDDA